MKYFMSVVLLSAYLTGCAKEDYRVHTTKVETSQEGESLRQLSESQLVDEPSCLEQCGQEARGTIYADCLADGGTQQACGIDGRAWYRNCLETRCDEEAILQDDCRTECRLNAKNERTKCISDGKEPQDCRTEIGAAIRTCIAECE